MSNAESGQPFPSGSPDRISEAIAQVMRTFGPGNSAPIPPAHDADSSAPSHPANETYAVARLEGTKILDKPTARSIWDTARSGEPLADGATLDRVSRVFATTEPIDPYAAVVGIAASSPQAAELMAASTGVFEGYRVHEHTQAVLGRFDALFAGQFSAEECQIIRMAMGLHEMGKPIAKTLSSLTEMQERYTPPIMQAMLRDMDSLTPEQKKIIVLLASHDFIGQGVRGMLRLDQALNGLDAIRAACPPQYQNRINAYMEAMYLSDATAYTSEATYQTPDGQTHTCKPALDRHFHRTPDGIIFDSPLQQRLFDILLRH